MTTIRHTVSSILQRNEPKTMLCFALDGQFESMLAETPHNFFVMPVHQIQGAAFSKIRSGCKNLSWFSQELKDVPIDMHIDGVICNNRLSQYEVVNNISTNLCVPIIVVDHFGTYKCREEDITLIQQQHQMTTVSISESIANQWKVPSTVIPYGIDSSKYTCNKNDKCTILMIGHIPQGDYAVISDMLQGHQFYVIGNNPGMSSPAQSYEEMIQAIDSSSVFLNMTAFESCPIALLEAMAAKCVIISLKHPSITDILNEQNSILCNTVEEIKIELHKLKLASAENKLDQYQKLSNNAHQLIVEKFSMDTFITKWNDLLSKLPEKAYVR